MTLEEFKNKTKWIIVSPHGRRGGTIALHLLCQGLRNHGCDCKIFYPEAVSMPGESIVRFRLKSTLNIVISAISRKNKKSTPVSGYKRCYFPFVGNNTIVVYPERFCGNFLHGKKVVRWLLNRPTEKIISTYGKNDLIFAYRNIFNVESINPSGRLLRLFSFDRQIFKQDNFGKREGCCYILHKGKGRNDLPLCYNGPIIDDWSFEDQVKALNKYEYCYIYDTQTGYGTIAALCGCVPVIMLEPGKCKSDYVSVDDVTYGRAYGNTQYEIEYARKTRNKLIEYLDSVEEKNNERIQHFIRECRSFFYGVMDTTL